jgi:YD repeat-containing protein
MPRHLFLLSTAAVLMGLTARAAAEEPAAVKRSAPDPGVFDAPEKDFRLQLLVRQVFAAAAAGRTDEAEKLLRDEIAKAEISPAMPHYHLACLLAVRGDTEAALDSLAAAVAAGFDNVDLLAKTPALQPLRQLPRFRELGLDVLERAQRKRRQSGPLPKPRPVQNGVAEVAEENSLWVPQLARFVVAHEFPAAASEPAITTENGPVGDLLRQWRKEGTAAGLRGFLYDNHDEDHSNMDYGRFPELARVEYADVVKKTRTTVHGLGELHRGLQLIFVFGAPTIGNASVAQTHGAFWRSMPRLAMANAAAMNLLADQYANNMLYFYPEHRDHDPEADKGFGDVYPANVPYVITSQGSSGSDRAFMNAVASTMAAFRPDTQRFLIDNRLLVPTVQMIFRTCRTPVAGRDDYLSGTAHPPVFDAGTLDVERMVRMAHDLKADDVPPLVRLKVEEEQLGRPGIDYCEAGTAEKTFDTVSAVARVARSARYRRRMVVGTTGTKDPHGRPLSFIWKLLHGDENRVRIRPLDPLGTRAEIIVDWHPRGVHPGSDLPSSRVDVGVFADNGATLSAPAFVTWYFPANEKRTYEDVPASAAADRQDPVNGDSPKRIVSIERLPPDASGSYVDPLLVTPASWTDTYRYDDRGDLLGWTRNRGDTTEEFTRDGLFVETTDDHGRPVRTREMGYVREQKDVNAVPVLRGVPGPRTVTYRYASEADLLGEAGKPTADSGKEAAASNGPAAAGP